MMNCADETAAQADAEVKKLLDRCYDKAKTILTENRALLDEIALFLLQKETLTGDEFMSFLNAEDKSAEETPMEECAEDTPSQDDAEV